MRIFVVLHKNVVITTFYNLESAWKSYYHFIDRGIESNELDVQTKFI